MTGKRPALGRGLETLLGPITGGASSINEIELSKIYPNEDQPRTIFEEDALEELASSIHAVGVIQPITVQEIDPDHYKIISGERRYRAAKKVGLQSIPAYVKKASDDGILEMALIENIQREDLNAIDIALAYNKLIEAFGFTQAQLSERVGKKRTTIANYLRLLNLPSKIQIGLKDRKIDMGHARALIPVADPDVQEAIFEQIVKEGLSVRTVEEMVREQSNPQETEEADNNGLETNQARGKRQPTAEEYKPLKEQLSKFFDTKVQLTVNDKGKGKISIPFASAEDFERLMTLFNKLGKVGG
jgi:ParB family chromosome partitioning protein